MRKIKTPTESHADIERVAIALFRADDLGKRLPWSALSPQGDKQRDNYRRLARVAVATLNDKEPQL